MDHSINSFDFLKFAKVLIFLAFATNLIQASAEVKIGFLKLSENGVIESELGQTQSMGISVTSSQGFKGKVRLSVLTPADEKVGKDAVKFALGETDFNLEDGETKQTDLQISVATYAKDYSGPITFTAREIHNNSNSSTPIVTQSVELRILPTYRVYLHGRYTDGSKGEKFSIEQGKNVKFANHADGIMIHFINLDKNERHYIHSTSIIPHQSGPYLEKYPGNGTGKDITYSYLVKNPPENGSTTIYCHEHENQLLGRKLIFNAQ